MMAMMMLMMTDDYDEMLMCIGTPFWAEKTKWFGGKLKKNRVASNVPIVAMNWRDNVGNSERVRRASGAGSAVGLGSGVRRGL